MKTLGLLPVFLVLLASCGGSQETNTEADAKGEDSLMMDSMRTQVKEFVHIFPSHLKVARLFKNAGLKYEGSYLLTSSQADKLMTTQDKAFGLGFFGVDMAYTAINNQTQASINFLKVSKSLSQQLGLESVYESNHYLQKFEANLNNVDTLEAIIRDLFAESDAFLKDNDKLDVTLLTFAGGWTESVYLAASYARSTKNQAIVEIIGDQLVSLDPLIRLLGENQKNFDNKALIKQLTETKKILESGIVKPETETEPMIFQLTEKQLDELIAKLKEIRSKVNNA
ncbi:MAG TPA: hypothetical protein PLK63_11200 [Catalimonadaceae bacterium]|nr:hypothetical protein [Catalimonadaceae bacterium]